MESIDELEREMDNEEAIIAMMIAYELDWETAEKLWRSAVGTAIKLRGLIAQKSETQAGIK